MGYFLTTEAETAVSAKSHASPKTHTPLPRLQERGHRYYSATLSRWISRDPIGERADLALYVAFLNSPPSKVDRLGKTTMSCRTTGVQVGSCGKYEWEVSFGFMPDKDGFMIQKVDQTVDAYWCNGTPLTKDEVKNRCEVDLSLFPFWEAASIWNGVFGTWDPFRERSQYTLKDKWAGPGCGQGTYGTITVTGSARFHDDYQDLPDVFNEFPGNPYSRWPNAQSDPGMERGGPPTVRKLVRMWSCCDCPIGRYEALGTSIGQPSAPLRPTIGGR